ncbi:MAG: hypothetical protein JWO48_3868, partial [Bryobacterales bacterium]|nr:hypothetical protein [Bryobacterales bacterium]
MRAPMPAVVISLLLIGISFA